MSRMDTLFGAALGAAIVGATLVVHEIMTDPEKSAEVRARVCETAQKVGAKAGEACTAARRKAVEVGSAVRERAEKSETVRRIREQAEKVLRRKKADAPATELDEEATHPVADGVEPEVTPDPLASEEDAHFSVT